MNPVKIQINKRLPGDPTSRIISADTIKIPEPIIVPATSIVESKRPKRCWNCLLSMLKTYSQVCCDLRCGVYYGGNHKQSKWPGRLQAR